MPRYLVERVFDQKVEKLGPGVSQKAIRLMDEIYTSVTWEHSHIAASTDDGVVRTFCIYAAPDPEVIRAHAAAVGGHLVINVYELAGDVAPADIPPPGEAAPGGFFERGTT